MREIWGWPNSRSADKLAARRSAAHKGRTELGQRTEAAPSPNVSLSRTKYFDQSIEADIPVTAERWAAKAIRIAMAPSASVTSGLPLFRTTSANKRC